MSRTTATRTFVPRTELWADGDGMIHYVVPPLTYVTDEQGRVFAATGNHVYGRRTRVSFGLTVTSALVCPYCERMCRIATMGGV